MQEGKRGENADLERQLNWYHRFFGATDIFRSKNVCELNKHIGANHLLSTDMYDLLLEYTSRYAAEIQKEVCYKLSGGFDLIEGCGCAEYPDCGCDDEPETAEQREARLGRVKRWSKMSPKDFWLEFMT